MVPASTSLNFTPSGVTKLDVSALVLFKAMLTTSQVNMIILIRGLGRVTSVLIKLSLLDVGTRAVEMQRLVWLVLGLIDID